MKKEVEPLGWITIYPATLVRESILRGQYNDWDDRITLDGPKSSGLISVQRLIVLYDPRGNVSRQEMLGRFEENGDIPCGFYDALEIGAAFPERQIQNHLPFLGESALFGKTAMVLRTWFGKRELGLRSLDRLLADDRFPAIRTELPR